MKHRQYSTADHGVPGFYPASPVSRTHLAQQRQQSHTRQPQIGQRKQCHDLHGVLRQTTITNLQKPNWRFTTRKKCSTIAQTADNSRLNGFCSSVSAPPAGFFSMQTALHQRNVRDHGHCAFHGMNQTNRCQHRRQCAPSCRSATDCLSWSAPFPDRASCFRSWSNWAPQSVWNRRPYRASSTGLSQTVRHYETSKICLL
mgnify:CR=1 FL=1